DVAMINEVLCKILCHNICCLIQSMFELGIEVKWTPNTGPLDRGVFVKGFPRSARPGLRLDRPRPGSGSRATNGDAPHRRTGSRPSGPPPVHELLTKPSL